MEGLRYLGNIPERSVRDEFVVLYDEPVYDVVKRFASRTDMQEIDGWARSFYTLEGHMQAIMSYQKPLLQEPKDPIWTQSKQEVMNEIINTIPIVTSLKFETQLDKVPFESSSAAGYGYPGRKGEGNNLKRAKGIANALVRQYSETKLIDTVEAENHVITESTPDIAFTRTQLAKLPSIKVRNVYGEAFHYILIEGLSASPLLEAFKRADTFYLIGKDPVKYVPTYLSKLDQIEGYLIALDWSSFDSTVQLWEIDHAFACLQKILTFPTQLSQCAFEVAKISFKERKLAAPDGTMWMRKGGLPSGSYFTNLIGSIINYTRIRYACNKLRYSILDCRVQGDDSIIKVTAPFTPDVFAIVDTVAQFGWILNPLKCVVAIRSESVTFLGRQQYQLFNIRERLKILRLMCFPEFKVEDPKISTARVKAIAIDAGFRDPLYNSIYYAMKSIHGEADFVPPHLLTYTDKSDFTEVNM